MVRVTNSVASRRRKNRTRKASKGFVGDRRNHLRLTTEAVMRAMAYNYRHRKERKREFRSIWIMRLNAAAKANGLSYSRLIEGLIKAECLLNRKMLSEIAIHDPVGFTAIVETAKASLAPKKA